jgi:isoamylase
MLDTRYAKWSEQPNVLIRQVHMQAFRSICVFKCTVDD